MELEDLRVFLAVVEHGSLLAAAEALGLARSTMRARLERLEDTVGEQLFVRARQGTKQTAAAAILVPHARAILAHVSALPAALHASESSARHRAEARSPPRSSRASRNVCSRAATTSCDVRTERPSTSTMVTRS